MNLMLTLFILSLLSIIGMIGRKLVLLRRESPVALQDEEVLFEIPYIEEVKEITAKNIKRYGYLGLVTTIRLYFRSSSMVKNTYQGTKEKVKGIVEKNKKYLPLRIEGSKETSGFLRAVSEYKEKIGKIKHKIREEEKKL